MKNRISILILGLICILLIGLASFLWITLQKTTDELNSQIIQLQKEVVLRDNLISDMDKMAYPKSFENQKVLEKWLKTTSDKSKYEYYSEAAVELIKEARAEGYWMELAPVKFVYDSSGLPSHIEYPIATNGVIICMTVVGGGTLYLVDPCTLSVMEVSTMQADFDLNDLKLK